MHELSITESMIAAVADKVGDRKVQRVTLAVGKLSGVVADSVYFYFDLCAEGTSLEGAKLEIIEVAGKALCRTCASEVELVDMIALCPCGSADLEILAGEDLRIKEVEVAV
ncbi:MAG: hydrogenase maturation nickel metallochaperone HypA [Actinomycetota bacterium]